MMTLDRRGKLRSDHYKQPGHKNIRRGACRIRFEFGVRHRTGDLTGPAADAFFRIALDKRAELFRYQDSRSATGQPFRFSSGFVRFSAEGTASVSCGIYPVLLAATVIHANKHILTLLRHNTASLDLFGRMDRLF